MIRDRLIVIVDDDPNILQVICGFLADKGAKAVSFGDCGGLFAFLSRQIPDLIILDVVLPGISGFDICKKLKSKEKTSDIPVIMLSGRDSESSKVSGLDSGADDYVVKPFSLHELEARIKAVLRRSLPARGGNMIEAGNSIKIDLGRHEVFVEKEPVGLTPAEFKIFELLVSKQGRVFSRGQILERLWGDEKFVTERTVDVHIRHLRKKLGPSGKMIKSIRGVGYSFKE